MTLVRSSTVGRVLVCLLVSIGLLSCKGRDEEPQQQPERRANSSPAPSLTLSKDSPVLVSLRTERVAVRPLKRELKAQAGKIVANENRLAHLSSRVPGRIVAVYANLGDQVKTGDRLLLLDSPELGATQLEYRKARTGLSVVEKSFERAKMLLERKVIGVAEYQRREGEYQNALAEVHESEEKLHLLGMREQEIKRLSGPDLPHAQVAQVPLRASISGEVIQRNATVGEVIDPSKSLFTVADLSMVWVQADFPEQQVAHLKVGLSIAIKIAAYPDETFTGRISYLSSVIDPATRTVRARADVPNPNRKLRPEMFAEVNVVLDDAPGLAVPASALQQAGEKTIVFLVRGERRFERREVVVGPVTDRYAAVMSGLAENDEVVTEGSYLLKSELLKEQMGGGEGS
ncbi:MAG: efflux RND transporter periplasmic adaptor subunit [Nitrospiraceae bacterium]